MDPEDLNIKAVRQSASPGVVGGLLPLFGEVLEDDPAEFVQLLLSSEDELLACEDPASELKALRSLRLN